MQLEDKKIKKKSVKKVPVVVLLTSLEPNVIDLFSVSLNESSKFNLGMLARTAVELLGR